MSGPPLLPPHHGDGDGWVTCELGHRHWGVHGAAGLLLAVPGDRRDRPVLLQHRASWTHHGGTWGMLGGARRRAETAEQAAIREAAEEGGLDVTDAQVAGEYVDDHGGWAYTTVLATADSTLPAAPTGPESADVVWVPLAEVESRALHPGFAASWPVLRGELDPVRVVVDAANVVGSRPDGWWRDRAGAATRLLARIGRLAADGVHQEAVPVPTALHRLWPRWEVVLEGAARAAEDPADGDARVRVVRAEGYGDDTIAARSASVEGSRTVVVTADRGLAERVRAQGASVTGPKWLLALLEE